MMTITKCVNLRWWCHKLIWIWLLPLNKCNDFWGQMYCNYFKRPTAPVKILRIKSELMNHETNFKYSSMCIALLTMTLIYTHCCLTSNIKSSKHIVLFYSPYDRNFRFTNHKQLGSAIDKYIYSTCILHK